nr:hypothetical protein WMHIBSEC_WMHIBSEC_CDS_0014 [Caudoviricetes sp.]CAI9751676.1 hypothetical protein AZFZUZMX_AZFZUZMX_CDS_0014 [Caudoviricetes sp.]
MQVSNILSIFASSSRRLTDEFQFFILGVIC